MKIDKNCYQGSAGQFLSVILNLVVCVHSSGTSETLTSFLQIHTLTHELRVSPCEQTLLCVSLVQVHATIHVTAVTGVNERIETERKGICFSNSGRQLRREQSFLTLEENTFNSMKVIQNDARFLSNCPSLLNNNFLHTNTIKLDVLQSYLYIIS